MARVMIRNDRFEASQGSGYPDFIEELGHVSGLRGQGGSLVGQDWSKLAIAALIVASSLFGSFEKRFVQQTAEWVQEPGKAGEMRPIPARMKNNDEILPLRFFSPRKPGPLNPPRQKKPGAENKTGGDS